MRKSFIMIIPILFCFIFTSFSSAQNYFGWWKCTHGVIQVGDFVTGEWVKNHITSEMASYLYITNSNKAYLIEYDFDGQGFFLENEFTYFERNNLFVLTGPYNFDANGDFLYSSTGIIKASGQLNNPRLLELTYTSFDLENLYVKRFNIKFTRVLKIENIPDEVKQLIPYP